MQYVEKKEKRKKNAIFSQQQNVYIANLSYAHIHKLIILEIQPKCNIENMND